MQRIEKKVWVDLCFQIVQFRDKLFIFQLLLFVFEVEPVERKPDHSCKNEKGHDVPNRTDDSINFNGLEIRFFREHRTHHKVFQWNSYSEDYAQEENEFSDVRQYFLIPNQWWKNKKVMNITSKNVACRW